MKAVLPVSKKFYTDITVRVTNALSFSPSSIIEAMRIIDRYLDGETVASSDPAAKLAFNMIRDEIDRAVARSRRARKRGALKREEKRAKGEKEVLSETKPDDGCSEPESEKPLPHISRRERRAMSRALTKRQGKKWKSIQSSQSLKAS